jgi:hypothetical protein
MNRNLLCTIVGLLVSASICQTSFAGQWMWEPSTRWTTGGFWGPGTTISGTPTFGGALPTVTIMGNNVDLRVDTSVTGSRGDDGNLGSSAWADGNRRLFFVHGDSTCGPPCPGLTKTVNIHGRANWDVGFSGTPLFTKGGGNASFNVDVDATDDLPPTYNPGTTTWAVRSDLIVNGNTVYVSVDETSSFNPDRDFGVYRATVTSTMQCTAVFHVHFDAHSSSGVTVNSGSATGWSRGQLYGNGPQ